MLRVAAAVLAVGSMAAAALLWLTGPDSPADVAPAASPAGTRRPAAPVAGPPQPTESADVGAAAGSGSRRPDPTPTVSEPSGPVGQPAATQPTSGPLAVTTNHKSGPAHRAARVAVALLRAEITGVGRAGFGHLAEARPPCCSGFRPRGAAVLFADPPESGPVRVVVSWSARGHDGRVREETTTVRLRRTVGGWQPTAANR